MPCTIVVEDTQHARYAHEIANEVATRSVTGAGILVVSPERDNLLVNELKNKEVPFELFTPKYAGTVTHDMLTTFRMSPIRYTLVIYNCWWDFDGNLADLEHILKNDMADVIVTVPRSATEALWLPLLRYASELLVHRPRTYYDWAATHIPAIENGDAIVDNLEKWRAAGPKGVRAMINLRTQAMTLIHDTQPEPLTASSSPIASSLSPIASSSSPQEASPTETKAEEWEPVATARATATQVTKVAECATYSYAPKKTRAKRVPLVKRTRADDDDRRDAGYDDDEDRDDCQGDYAGYDDDGDEWNEVTRSDERSERVDDARRARKAQLWASIQTLIDEDKHYARPRTSRELRRQTLRTRK